MKWIEATEYCERYMRPRIGSVPKDVMSWALQIHRDFPAAIKLEGGKAFVRIEDEPEGSKN